MRVVKIRKNQNQQFQKVPMRIFFVGYPHYISVYNKLLLCRYIVDSKKT